MGTNYHYRPQDEESSLSFQQMLDLRAENLERRFQEQEEKRKVEEALREKAYQKMKAKEPPRQWEPRVRQADVWQLTPDELALYLRIAYHARPPRYLCVTKTATLCDSCLSDKKVRAAKKTLEKKKRIEIKHRFNQTDQIKLVNPVLDRSDVYVPLDVVRRLLPSELAIYCRIANRDRGTGCKAQNKELATKVCTVRQVANILAKLESDGLIRRYEVDGKRFISSSAYGFKAHAAHLAELEKQAAALAKLRLIREGIMDPPKNEDESGQDIAYAIDKIHRNRLGGWY